jgi:hypothetical protein
LVSFGREFLARTLRDDLLERLIQRLIRPQ